MDTNEMKEFARYLYNEKGYSVDEAVEMAKMANEASNDDAWANALMGAGTAALAVHTGKQVGKMIEANDIRPIMYELRRDKRWNEERYQCMMRMGNNPWKAAVYALTKIPMY